MGKYLQNTNVLAFSGVHWLISFCKQNMKLISTIYIIKELTLS